MSVSAVTDEPAYPSVGGQDLWGFADEAGMRALVIGTSKVPNAKITVLLVSPATGRAELAAKVPTTDVAAAAVEDEASMLRALEELAPEMASTIPRVVDWVDFHGRAGVVMTAMHGTPMSTAYTRGRHTADPARVGADFAAVDRWLTALQRATAGGSMPVDLGDGVADRLTARYGEDDAGEAGARLAQMRGRLSESAVPRTAVHGDLWLSNVLLTDGVVSGVVDWEGAETSGDPLRDLVRFPVTYALFIDRHTKPGRAVRGHPGLRAGAWGAGVEYALDGHGWFPDLVRGFLQRGLVRLGADPARWRDAALVGVAELAALTDDPVFGRSVLELFRRLAR
jgi:aminoglycoside phosphotransferase (APT) family kinase protein